MTSLTDSQDVDLMSLEMNHAMRCQNPHPAWALLSYMDLRDILPRSRSDLRLASIGPREILLINHGARCAIRLASA